jgi:poly(hydroxyalkanoate) granule-associated protein
MASSTNSGGEGSRAGSSADASADALRESAEKIWLAGLGAFERMKSEGPRMFETLVEQGRDMSVRAKDAADQALRSVREANFETGGARWDKFQQDMHERFSKSLGTLGLSSTKQVESLAQQVAELNEQMRNLMSASARGGGARKPSRAAAGSKKKKAAAPKRKTAAAKGRTKARSR